MLDQLTAEQVKARVAGTSSSQSADAKASLEKPFSHWIRGAPKEKWSFLYDTNGMWYGIQTTTHVECFNMVMRNCRGFPLVGIVEFIMYGCMKYFRERYMAATINMSNPQIQFCTRVTQYMQDKIAKARQHRVISTGTREHRFEVLCKDRTSRGIRRDRVVQESLIRADGTARCTCMKPKLLHLPCSHVIAACAESGLQPGVFVSPYFSKEAATSTWGHEIYGIGIVGPFITDREVKTYVPDPAAKKGKGRRQTRRIRNGMDESEASKAQKRCSQCGALGHNYKRCPQNAIHGDADAGPSGNPTDGAPPTFRPPLPRIARGRHSVS